MASPVAAAAAAAAAAALAAAAAAEAPVVEAVELLRGALQRYAQRGGQGTVKTNSKKMSNLDAVAGGKTI